MSAPAVCGVRGEFLGIPVGPCGQQAEVLTVGVCAAGHRRERAICVDHADTFALLPDQVLCEQCDAEGIDSLMTVTVVRAGESA